MIAFFKMEIAGFGTGVLAKAVASDSSPKSGA